MTLTEPVEGYLLGRGAQEQVIADLGCVTWDASRQHCADNPQWLRQFGKEGRGEYIDGWLVIPLLNPRGQVIGFESRRTDIKKFHRWMMPEAAWSPGFTGLTPAAMKRLWDGGDVWLVEGTFDMFALQWGVPDKDVVLGTITAALNRRQTEFLRRLCKGWVHVAYDRDGPGRKGTHGWTDDEGKFRWGALQKLEHQGIRCRDVPYSGVKDPGEIWDRRGAEGIRSVFAL